MTTREWNFRKAIGSDLSFIYSTWLKSYRYDSAIGKGCTNTIFFPEYSKVIDRILYLDNTEVDLAVHLDNPEVVFGYIVHSPDIVHYIFVKQAFMGAGLATSLIEHIGPKSYFTHRTKEARYLMNKYPQMTYNPFLLFNQERPHGAP